MVKKRYLPRAEPHVAPIFIPRAGHEECRTCGMCGLPYCPDCDEYGRCCPLFHNE